MQDVILPRYVYFAKVEELRKMKIGCSVRPFDRLVAIAEWVPFKVEIVATTPGGVTLEKQFHSHFQKEWSHMEWFNISPRMEKMVDDIQAGREFILDKCQTQTKQREYTKLKCMATRLINQAETRAGIPEYRPTRWAVRPAYVWDAITSYDARNNPPPDDAVFAVIKRYEEELTNALEAK